jgi:uncharacterized protein with von Willebrand factor type A (vWA) domain
MDDQSGNNMESVSLNPESEQNALSGFLSFARNKGIRISTSEWLNFLGVVEEVGQDKEIIRDDFYGTLKALGSVTLVKDKADIAIYSEAFDEFFWEMKVACEEESQQQAEVQKKLAKQALDTDALQEQVDGSQAPKVKEQLGIEEVKPNDLDGEHGDDETSHGGKRDQHNDILRKVNEKKIGGGSGEHNAVGDGSGIQQKGTDVGIAQYAGGKGNSKVALPGVPPGNLSSIIYHSKVKNPNVVSGKVRSKDRRERYNIRPDRTDIHEVVKNLRQIITDTSQVTSNQLDVLSTVDHFAKKEFTFDYENEREVRPETVLFIDVGGPVDEWRPLMEELSKGMSRGLLKLEIYLFHNQLYGYCWDPKDGNYAKPNGLKNVRDIVKKRKKVIIYGDADMDESEVEYDNYPPSGNEEKIRRYGMDGLDCLQYIKRNSENVVWINPMFKSSWYYDSYNDDYDTDNSIGQISDVIQMYDLSIGGVQDAIADLMKK